MNSKNFLAIALLMFVAVAVATIIAREQSDEASDSHSQEASEETPENGLVAYYFHGKTRCPTCRKIEIYAQEAIQTGFAKELNSGEVQWQVVDYEIPTHAHFTTDYEIVASTVVLAKFTQGKQTDWRNLMRVWELVGDKQAFTEYLQGQVKDLLSKTNG